MASGILGQVSLASTTNTTVYTVPASTLSIVNINIVNRHAESAATVRVAIAAAAGPALSEYIEYDAEIPKLGVLERTGIAIDASKNVVAYANTTSCSVNVYGLEQSA